MHPPGPWKVKPAQRAFGIEVYDRDGELICMMSHHPSRQIRARANADMIALFPEMREALEEFVDVGSMKDAPLVVEKIRQIVAKLRETDS